MTEERTMTNEWQQDEYSDKIWRHDMHRGKQITILLSAADVNALETRVARAEAKAALADEIRPLVEILTARIGRLKFGAPGESWEVFEAYTKIARDGNTEGPCWLARFDALDQGAQKETTT